MQEHHCNRQGRGAPPAALVADWSAGASGALPPGARWVPRTGGPRRLVAKRYRAEAAAPLFANDAGAEAMRLAALTGTGLAPAPGAAGDTPAGRRLVCGHVAGRLRSAEDGRGPHSAHPMPNTLPGFRTGAQRLRRAAMDVCTGLGPDGAAVVIHGDPTLANTLVTPAGIPFVDWQCPGDGDPADAARAPRRIGCHPHMAERRAGADHGLRPGARAGGDAAYAAAEDKIARLRSAG